MCNYRRYLYKSSQPINLYRLVFRGVFDRQDSLRSDYLSDRESRYGIVQQASIDSTDSRLCYLTSSEVSVFFPFVVVFSKKPSHALPRAILEICHVQNLKSRCSELLMLILKIKQISQVQHMKKSTVHTSMYIFFKDYS